MKETQGSPPWVPVVVGVVGLLAVGLGVRHWTSSPSPEPDAEPRLAANARRAESERGGWIAQPQGRTGSASMDRGRFNAPSGRAVDGRTGGTGSSDSGTDDFAPPRRGGDDVGDRDYRDTDTVDTGGDAIAARPHVAPMNAGGAGSGPAAGSGQGEGSEGVAGNHGGAANGAARPQAGAAPAGKSTGATTDASQTEGVAAGNDPAKPAAADDGSPSLSLPLDKSVEPDKGDTSPIVASGVTFDAEGAHFATDGQMFIPSAGNVDPTAGTFNFWMLPDWAGDTEMLLSPQGQFQILHYGANTFENHIDIFQDHRYLRFLFTPNTGIESGAGVDDSNWKPGDRHMITTTWGDGVTAMYVDAVSVGAKEYEGELDVGSNPAFFLGSGNPKINGGKAGANSNIRNFQIYTHALSSDEIVSLFGQPPS